MSEIIDLNDKQVLDQHFQGWVHHLDPKSDRMVTVAAYGSDKSFKNWKYVKLTISAPTIIYKWRKFKITHPNLSVKASLT